MDMLRDEGIYHLGKCYCLISVKNSIIVKNCSKLTYCNLPITLTSHLIYIDRTFIQIVEVS